MPRSEASYALTDAYRRQLLALRDAAVATATAAWAAINPSDLDGTYAAWAAAAAAVTAASGRMAVAATSSYLEEFLGRELDVAGVTVPAVDLERAEQGRDGRPLIETLQPPLYTIKSTLLQRRPLEQALASGLARAVRTVSVEVMADGRDTLDEISRQDTRIVGWRRATTGGPCGACLAAATGAIQHTDVVLRVHAHCRCVKEPVVAGVQERIRRPSGQELFDRLTPTEQDNLFAGRGGQAKADLVRDGDVPLEALLTAQPKARAVDDIVETPLSALTSS